MTPEELDAIERDYEAYGYAYIGSSVPDLIAALREAWDEATDGPTWDAVRLRQAAEAALDRVRALCEPTAAMATVFWNVRHVAVSDVIAAIEGESE